MDKIGIIQLTFSAFVLYVAIEAVRRLYFSKISHIPGPRLAALTCYYQTYWDLWPYDGQFMFHLKDLHKHYGPIVRIGPDEIHIDDPSFMSECYPSSTTRRRDKSPVQFGWFQGTGEFSDGSSFSTLSHQLHRSRRAGIAPFFSKQMVRELEPRVQQKVLQLRAALLERSKSEDKEEQLVDLNNAMSALTMDVISEYGFGRSVGALDRSDLAKPYNTALREAMKIHALARAFPPLIRTFVYLPKWIINLSPFLMASEGFRMIVEDLSEKAFADVHNADAKEKRTVLHSIIQSPEVPESEKAFHRIKNEGMILFGAGTETTGRTLAIGLLHILANPPIHARLLKELTPLIPSYHAPLPPASELEALPFLTAVINEALRMGHGVAGNPSRIAPDEDLVYPNRGKEPVIIPAGTTFSQSLYANHTNDEIYPEPFTFRPERFLASDNADDAEIEAVNRAKANLSPFGRGTRICAGMNLAYSELYLTIASVIAGLRLELAEGVTEKEGQIVAEYFVGYLDPTGKGITVRVLGER